jgi:hypothetical protein
MHLIQRHEPVESLAGLLARVTFAPATAGAVLAAATHGGVGGSVTRGRLLAALAGVSVGLLPLVLRSDRSPTDREADHLHPNGA